MADLIARLKSEAPVAWQRLSGVQKASLLAVALATLVAIFFVTDWAQRTEYSAVFTGLSEGDASAIVTKLKELKIPYQLTDGGGTVRVPSNMVYDVRLQLASQGLPKGGAVGFELFDKVSFGLTDFAQKLNFQRALEGELSRTIGRLSGVEEARVHIVLPQDELFVEREKPTTASVVLKVKPGMELDARQIRGVVNLVARSVEGLKPENVTVLDGDGLLLSGQDEGSLLSAAGTAAQREAQRVFERSLQRDIQAMLEQVLGPRKAVVRVAATLDWDQHESSSETYSPPGKPAQIRSSKEVIERSATPLGDGSSLIPSYPLDGRAPAGPVSPSATPAATATPQATAGPATAAAPTATPAVADPKYERREITSNYEVSKVVERSVRAPGAVKKLSVAVLLDGQLEEALVSTITKSVTAAAGLDAGRGDSVVVANLPFNQSTNEEREKAAEEAAKRELYVAVAKGALVAFSLLVVLLLVRSLIKGLTGGGRGREAAMGKSLVKKQASENVALAAVKVPAKEEDPRPTQVLREVTKLAQAEPKLLAQIVKSWLDEKG